MHFRFHVALYGHLTVPLMK